MHMYLCHLTHLLNVKTSEAILFKENVRINLGKGNNVGKNEELKNK